MMPNHLDPLDVVFVATDLAVLREAVAPAGIDDVTIGGKTYRPLDPEYYAWLRRKMELAKTACDRGKLSPKAFDALRIRFNLLHDQALALFGESALLEAIEHLDPKTYAVPGSHGTQSADISAEIPKSSGDSRGVVSEPKPRCSRASDGIPEVRESSSEIQPTSCSPARSRRPSSFPEKASPSLPFDRKVTREAVRQVDAVREQALALGWTEAELYQTRGRFAFPCGPHYGLVCFVGVGQTLGSITSESIEICIQGGRSLRFYRRIRS